MKKDNVAVSVILPVYNVELFLADCLESILSQTLQNIEIIAVNDGSTDKSSEILEQYAQKDKRIKIISQENKGLSAARNAGIKKALGEFISFVDSDDLIEPQFLEKLYHAAVTHKADIAACGYYQYGPKGKINIIHDHQNELEAITLKEKLKSFYIIVWNKIYNREKLIKNNLFFREGVRFEDMYWSPIVMEKLGKGVWVTGVYYHYRYNLASITKSDDDIKKQNALLAANTYYYYFLYSRKLRKPQKDSLGLEEKRRYRILGLTCITVLICKTKTVIKLFGLPIWTVERKIK